MVVNYQNGKIYKIVCNVTGDVYVGSTCRTLASRLSEHKTSLRNYLNGKSNYITSYKVLENNNYNIKIIKLFPCASKKELYSEESIHIKAIECVNKCIPNRSLKEWRADNKDAIKEQKREYAEKNKDLIHERGCKYREQNKERIKAHKSKPCLCDCGKTYTHVHKARHNNTKFHQNYINQNPT